MDVKVNAAQADTERDGRFAELEWLADRLLYRGLVFRLQHYIKNTGDVTDDCFRFFKTKPLIDQYEQFFGSMPSLRVKGVLELGMWDGGSSAFWFELLHLHKYVGIDCTKRQDSAYFRNYVESRNIADRVRTYWDVNQTDATQLRSILAKEFSGDLDLVIDDASHLYGPSKTSFEAIFPLLKPGALYIIEDWAWSYWPEYQSKDHPWAQQVPLSKLVAEFVAAVGSGTSTAKLIERLAVYGGFVALERGAQVVPDPQNFSLASCITTRLE